MVRVRSNPPVTRVRLEMKPKLSSVGSRCHEVRSTERGQEIVERNFVGDIDGCKPKAPLVLVTTKKIVVSHGNVEQVTRGNAGRVFVIILGARSGNADSR